MPYSARENDRDVIAFVSQNKIQTVLDVGAGSGTYGDLLSPHVHVIDALEIWSPYIHDFGLTGKYSNIIEGDVRRAHSLLFPLARYDLIIFGDVLEHMTKAESLAVWEWASIHADWGLISVPLGHYPQGASHGNPYEEHLQDHLTVETLTESYGPFAQTHTYNITTTLIRDFR